MSVSMVDADGIAKEIAGYVHRGLRVVRLHGVTGPGQCTCSKRDDCGSPGKHPVGKPWETTTDEDDVFEWWGTGARYNVGVVLGEGGRGTGPAVIDIEADSETATAELRRLGLDRYETPTWSSGRGLHRLFLWTPKLPDKAKVDRCGFEVRIGGGGKQAQSVMPPSAHHSGRAYRWGPGFGLADVELATVPDNVMEVILAAERQATRAPAADNGSGRRATAILRGPVGEGQRNDSLFLFACLLVRSVGVGDDAMEQTLLDGLRAMNTTHGRPPLTDEEVKSVFRSAIKYRREDAATEAIFPGVEAVVEGPQTVYRPAGLELTIHAGDPTMFELRCEEFRPFNPTGAVRVPADVWADSRKMKTALIGAFPGVPFDRHPGDFARIWDGTAPQPATRTRGAREAVTGLRVLLEQEATAAGRRVEVTDPAEHATRRLVGLMMMRLDVIDGCESAPCKLRGDDVPSDDEVLAELVSLRHGGWVGGRFWFVWDRLWRDIASAYGIERDASAKVARAIPEIIGRKLKPERFQRHGTRATLRSLTAHELETLRSWAAGGATAARGNTYGENTMHPEGRKGVAGVARGEENPV
jgi:hypothetical protein